MRRVFPIYFAAVVVVAATSAHALEASCDFRKCMSICRSEYESGCARMCGRIISLCRQLVVKPERLRSARRPNTSPHEPFALYFRARETLNRMD
jgi:hypothetical protein